MIRHYRTLMLVMFFLSVFCFERVNAIIRDYSLLGKCIYLDAGHGGYWKIQIIMNDLLKYNIIFQSDATN